jgi:hypothetical protein
MLKAPTMLTPEMKPGRENWVSLVNTVTPVKEMMYADGVPAAQPVLYVSAHLYILGKVVRRPRREGKVSKGREATPEEKPQLPGLMPISVSRVHESKVNGAVVRAGARLKKSCKSDRC